MKPRPAKKRLGATSSKIPSIPPLVVAKGRVLIVGRHAASHALCNPRRVIRAIYMSEAIQAKLAAVVDQAKRTNPSIAEAKLHHVTPRDLAQQTDSNPQGIAVVADPLVQPTLADWLHRRADKADTARVVVADRVQDPRNLGGILRSMWGLGAGDSTQALITPQRHASPMTAAAIKAASGAVEYIPLLGHANVSQAIGLLQKHGFFVVGLAAAEGVAIGGLKLHEVAKLAIVIGSEGAGLRRLTRQRVDQLAHIPIQPQAESLNASIATAIALYVATKG